MKTIEELKQLKPCSTGLMWAQQQPSLYNAWETCKRSDWMWWLLLKLYKTPKELSVAYSRQCADHVKHLNNRYAAYATDAADAAAARAAANAAYAAANAAYAAANAAYAAAYVAADAANAAYVAADAAYADAEREWQANLLRTLTTNPFDKS